MCLCVCVLPTLLSMPINIRNWRLKGGWRKFVLCAIYDVYSRTRMGREVFGIYSLCVYSLWYTLRNSVYVIVEIWSFFLVSESLILVTLHQPPPPYRMTNEAVRIAWWTNWMEIKFDHNDLTSDQIFMLLLFSPNIIGIFLWAHTWFPFRLHTRALARSHRITKCVFVYDGLLFRWTFVYLLKFLQ